MKLIDKDALVAEYAKGYDKGFSDMKQQMMKDTIVGTIHGNSWLDNRVIKADVPEEMKDKVGYYGDKVKLIIIKETDV